MEDLRSVRLAKAVENYYQAFGITNPEPWGVNDDSLASVLEEAVKNGKPIPDDYDWYADVYKNRSVFELQI